MTAGAAAAEVSLGGLARFGVMYNEGAAPESRLEHRFRLNIDAEATSDGGLTLGVRQRLQADDGSDGVNGTGGVATFNSPRFYAKTGSLEVGVGNTFGAVDSTPGLYVGSVGINGLGWANVVTNFGSDTYTSAGAGRNGVEVIYSAGSIGAHLSYSDLGGLQRTEAHLSFATGDWTFAVAGSNSDAPGDAEFVVTAGGKVGSFSVGLAAAQSVAGDNSITLGGDFSVGSATTVTAYVASDEAQVDKEAYGVGFVYDMGGGTSLRGGVAATHGTNRADLGVQFSF
jgi:outer membrane protein OmpU